MATPIPSIFRTEALEYRLRTQGDHRAEVVFPRLMARKVMIALWVMLGLLAIGGGIAFLPGVPVSTSGLAVPSADTARLAALLPASQGDVEPGAAASVTPGGRGAALDGVVVAVSPEPLDAAALTREVQLPAGVLATLQGPVTLAWVELNSDAKTMGVIGIGMAEIEVGRTPAGSYLPLVGRFFE
jgi:hypothetical protein